MVTRAAPRGLALLGAPLATRAAPRAGPAPSYGLVVAFLRGQVST